MRQITAFVKFAIQPAPPASKPRENVLVVTLPIFWKSTPALRFAQPPNGVSPPQEPVNPPVLRLLTSEIFLIRESAKPALPIAKPAKPLRPNAQAATQAYFSMNSNVTAAVPLVT